MNDTKDSLLSRFEQGDIDPQTFNHDAHLQVAFEMLSRYEFMDAYLKYASTLRAFTAGIGHPEKYNATITMAFMSLVAERRLQSGADNWEAFLASNPDLQNSNILNNWYTPQRLHSMPARELFLLPDKVSGPSVR